MIARLEAEPPVQLSNTALIRDGTTDRVLQLDNVPEFVTAMQLAEEAFVSGIIPRDRWSEEDNAATLDLFIGPPIRGDLL